MRDAFTDVYIECALWASIDDEGEPLDDRFDTIDIAPSALASMEEDCANFQTANAADLEARGDDTRSGHDFWLTRNRHGAGFWDRGLGELGKRLTDAAHSHGSSDLYIGDDGKIYVS